MYIDVGLIDDFLKRYPNHMASELDRILNECGVWYSPSGIKAEAEDFEMTLEEICSTYYFVIQDNQMFFASPNEIWEDIDRFMEEYK